MHNSRRISKQSTRSANAGGFFIERKMERGYSFLTIKAIDEDKRIIRGVATTPEPDRVGDIVEPMGADFSKDLPLLWMHQHDMPVGTVNFRKPTKVGIEFEAKMPTLRNQSPLKDRIDDAWESVKEGLVRAVSIGFRPIEWSIIEETGGRRYTKSEIYELSLVSVPANASATITQIKSLDKAALIASTGKKSAAASVPDAAVAAKTVKIIKPKDQNMSISEQIKQFRETLAAKNKTLVELAEKSAQSGETFDAADQEAFDTARTEISEIEGHLTRLEIAEKANISTAKPVTHDAGQGEKPAVAARQFAQVKSFEKVEPGIRMARVVKCLARANGNRSEAFELSKNLYKDDSAVIGVLKNAVAAGTTTNATWAEPLVAEESGVYADFVEFLRPQTILGKFGTNGIPSLRRVPFRTRLISQTSGGSGYWVGEGKAKPVTKFDFADTSLLPLKVANIAVLTEELIRDSSPAADVLVRDQLVAALRERLDLDFIDPAKTASAGVSPASITNGVTPISASGTDADAVRCDIAALLTAYIQANNPPMSGVLVMPAVTALNIGLMRNPLGQKEFPDITMNGGFLEGFPVITSEYVPVDSNGAYVIMINASDIYFADEGGFSVDMSREASLQMLDNPTNDATGSTAPTSLVSLWQTNCVGIRAERSLNWSKRRTSAVAMIENALYSNC